MQLPTLRLLDDGPPAGITVDTSSLVPISRLGPSASDLRDRPAVMFRS